ncbi:MAG TPA: ATP-binding cassette domain-containing protein [Solirubrobacteraceae bacterium]|jgi:ABC-type lipoprotein export system ATPase subunit
MTAGLLSLDSVSKSYWRGPHEVKVLVDVGLNVHAGELVAVWGKRGAGKTTLLKIATGLEVPDRGVVRFEGVDLAALSEAKRARLMRDQIGWVRRTGPRSELQMIDYVALPLLAEHGRREAYALARDALGRVRVAECAEQRWDSLSDGERALIGIARGIVRTPKLLLVDDPTTNLGVREREEIIGLLRQLVEEANLGVLMTAPDMPATMRSHQITALSGGRLLKAPGASGADDNVVDFPGRKRSA